MTSENFASKPAVAAPSRVAGAPAAAPAIARFPDFPPCADLMNPRHRHDPGHQPALRRHPGNPDTTVDGVYRPIAIRRHAAARRYGHSAALALQVCREYGALRWYDPAAQGYLDTFDSMADARDAAMAQRDAAEAEVRRRRNEIARLWGSGA